ncbi:MAG: DUF6502 family protein [Woeseiaceae bacterium]|nr:DUF6502 family protein [Woeseiaceae bacterium]
MQDSLKQQVLNAFLLVLRPITRILLRYGIGYREFVEVAKTAYVDVASSDYGLRGRPTNISRVAVMTGLTRKEVKRLRDKIASGDTTISVKTTPLVDVLHHWHAQPEYTDSNGKPAKLPFAGEKVSFSSLVKAFGGDVPAGAMRTELKRVGAVEEDSDGNLVAVTRVLIPEADHDNLITTLVHGAYAVLSNIAHNTNPENVDSKWASRIAHTTNLQKSDSGQLRRIARDRISDFAEAVDDLFIAYEALHNGEGDDKGAPVAVGVFYFEEQDKDAKYEW